MLRLTCISVGGGRSESVARFPPGVSLMVEAPGVRTTVDFVQSSVRMRAASASAGLSSAWTMYSKTRMLLDEACAAENEATPPAAEPVSRTK